MLTKNSTNPLYQSNFRVTYSTQEPKLNKQVEITWLHYYNHIHHCFALTRAILIIYVHLPDIQQYSVSICPHTCSTRLVTSWVVQLLLTKIFGPLTNVLFKFSLAGYIIIMFFFCFHIISSLLFQFIVYYRMSTVRLPQIKLVVTK